MMHPYELEQKTDKPHIFPLVKTAYKLMKLVFTRVCGGGSRNQLQDRAPKLISLLPSCLAFVWILTQMSLRQQNVISPLVLGQIK